MKLQLLKDDDGWRWRLRADNGKPLATSEAYTSKAKAKEAADQLTAALEGSNAKISGP